MRLMHDVAWHSQHDVYGVASEEEAIQFIDDIKFIVEDAFVD